MHLTNCDPTPHGVVLLRDANGDPQRIVGLRQARDAAAWRFAIAIGVAHPQRECWVIAGFEPHTAEEDARLDAARNHCGFDPRARAEELTAKALGAGVKRNAKEALHILTAGDAERERMCLLVDLELLRSRGARAGLHDFLVEEVRSRLLPLFASSST
ncbi:MAG: hypothetical protein HZA54_15830 [Planctomycetes bacterium]|nr:hypothetical protein [Planctomycetota bacterium]